MFQNHISSLGFTQEDDKLCNYIVDLINSPPSSTSMHEASYERGPCTILRRNGEPIELWYYFVKDKSSVLDDFFCAYQGTHYIEAYPCEWADDRGWNGPQLLKIETNGEIDELPINVWICDAPENVPIGTATRICLICCASRIQVFESLDKYRSAKLLLAPESLIPSGTFPPGDSWIDCAGEDYEQSSTIVMSGKVTEAEKRTNFFTGNDYYWMCVQSLGLELEVVAAADLLDELPEVGNYLHGTFDVQGYFDA